MEIKHPKAENQESWILNPILPLYMILKSHLTLEYLIFTVSKMRLITLLFATSQDCWKTQLTGNIPQKYKRTMQVPGNMIFKTSKVTYL